MAADVELLFGVQVPRSKSRIKKDLQRIITQINSSGLLKLRPRLDAASTSRLITAPLQAKLNAARFSIVVSNAVLDQAAVASLQQQINGVVGGTNTNSDKSKTRAQTKALHQKAQAQSNVNRTVKAGTVAEAESGRVHRSRTVAINSETRALLQKDGAERRAQAGTVRHTMAQKASTSATMASTREVYRLYTAIDTYLTKNPRVANTSLGQTLMATRDQLRGVYDTANKTGQTVTKMSKMKLANLQSTFDRAKNSLRAMNKEGTGFLARLKNIGERYGGYMLVSQALIQSWMALRRMVTAVTDINTAMTELRKVTTETSDAYDAFLTKATNRAKTLGATIADTVNATADFARLGYSLEDSSELADAALVYKNVGDGIDDISTASESIISTMKAFGIEADDAMSIVDRFNEVGNNFAISSVGIGEALTRSAAALSAAGNSIDESIALATAANNVVQDPEKVGTTLKTISMYLRAAKTDAEEAGESTDGMASSVSALRDEILALTGGKVDIQLDEDTFKNTYQILKELSYVWEDLSDISQANLLEMIGGKRNSNVVAAIISNFETAEEVIVSSANSAGSALAENEKYLDSINGKTAQFTAAMEAFSQSFIGEETVKKFVDVGTSLLEMLTRVTDVLGGLPALAGTIAAIVSMVRTLRGTGGLFTLNGFNNPFAGIQASIGDMRNLNTSIASYNQHIANGGRVNSKFIKSISNGSPALQGYFRQLNGGAASIGSLQKYAKSAGVSVAGLGPAFSLSSIGLAAFNAALSMGITLLISFAIQGIAKLINRQKELAEKTKEAAENIKSEYKSMADEIESDLKRISEIQDEFAKLSVGVDNQGKNISLTDDEYERYLELVNELIDINPSLVEAYNAEGQAIINNNEALEESIRLLEERESLNLRRTTTSDAVATVGESAVLELKELIKSDPSNSEYVDRAADEIANAIIIARNSVWTQINEDVLEPSSELPMMEQLFKSLVPDLDISADILQAYISSPESFVDEYFDQIVSNYDIGALTELGKYFPDAALDIESYIEDYLDALEVYSEDYADIQSSMHEIYNLVAQDTDGFENLSAQQQNFVSSWIDGFTFNEKFEKEDFREFRNQVRQFVEVLSDSNSDISRAFAEYLSVNSSDFTDISSYEDAARAACDALLLAIESSGFSVFGSLAESIQPKDYAQLAKNIDRYLAENIYKDNRAGGMFVDRIMQFSPEKIEAMFAVMSQEGVDSYESLLAAADEYLRVVNTAIPAANARLKDLWEAEDFADAKQSLTDIAKTSNGISPDLIKAYAEESEELAAILEMDGMNAEFLAEVLQEVAEGRDGFALITEAALDLNDALEGVSDRFGEATSQIEAFEKAASIDEEDANFRTLVDAYATLTENIDKGYVGDAFFRSAELLFGTDTLDELGWDPDKIIALAKESRALYADADSAGFALLEAVYAKADESGKLYSATGELLAEIKRNYEGGFDYQIYDIDGLADELNQSETAILSMSQALGKLGEATYYNVDEVIDSLHRNGFVEFVDGLDYGVQYAIANEELILQQLEKSGYNRAEALEIVQDLISDGVRMLSPNGDVQKSLSSLIDVGAIVKTGEDTFYLEAEKLLSTLASLNFTKDEIGYFIAKLLDSGINFTNADEFVAEANKLIDEYKLAKSFYKTEKDGTAFESEQSAAQAAIAALGDELIGANEYGITLYKTLQTIDGTEITTTIKVEEDTSGLSSAIRRSIFSSQYKRGEASNGGERINADSNASGTSYARAGYSLVGEEGTELVWSGDRAYTVGNNGPEMVKLNAGDVVYTAEQTRKILSGRGSKRARGSVPAYKYGKHNNELVSPLAKIVLSADADGSGYGEKIAGSADRPPKSGSSGSSGAAESIEEQLKDELDKLKDALDDTLGDFEHEIFLIEKEGGDYEEIIATYRKMQEHVSALEQKYFDMGLEKESDYIQELQKQWWEYQDAITEARQDAFDDYLNDKKFAIEVLEHDKADSALILDSWNEILDAINAEIEYYTSQGYDMTSDVLQDLIEESWDAKEEIVSHLEEYVEKANEIVDGFEDAYSVLTDAAKEYAETGYLSIDSLQSILELGPKYLEYLVDENGQLVINEESLQAVIAAKTDEMAASTALAYARQILQAAERNDIATLTELTQASLESTGATWDMAYATIGLAKVIGAANGMDASFFDDAVSYLTKMQSLSRTAVKSISSYYKTLDDSYISQKDALDQIMELTQEMIEWEIDQKIESLEKEKELHQEIVDRKKEMIELARKEDEHNDSTAEKLEKIAKLQSQIEQLSLDDSREANAQRRQLEEELSELQKDLADEQKDYAVDAQLDALDKEQTAFEENIDKEIELYEHMFDSTEKLYQAALDRINSGWDALYKNLLEWNYNYGSTLQSELESAWDAASEAVQRYGSYVAAVEGTSGHTNLGTYNSSGAGTDAASIVSRMRQNSIAWFTASDSAAQQNISSNQQTLSRQWESIMGETLELRNGTWYRSSNGSPLYTLSKDEVARAVVSQMRQNGAEWHNVDQSRRSELEQQNELLAARLQSFLGQEIKKTPAGEWLINGEKLFNKYHSGGIAGGMSTLKQDEVMAVLKKGEPVLDAQREKGLYRLIDFTQVLSERLGKAISADGLKSFFENTITLPKLGNASVATATPGAAVAMNPVVNININHSGELNESAAERFGNIAADTTLQRLNDAFSRRGITTLGGALLKQ